MENILSLGYAEGSIVDNLNVNIISPTIVVTM